MGLPSSGVHSNGYSLVRKVIAAKRLVLNRRYAGVGETRGGAVLRPTTIYEGDVLAVVRSYRARNVITGMAHVTGGGLGENVGRALGKGCDAVIETKSWERPPIFGFLQGQGIGRAEMFKVFNMGMGFVLIVRPRFAKGVVKRLEDRGASPVVMGWVKQGSGKVFLR